MSAAIPLTNTSYVVLGLLDMRPHSAYELTQQARRSLPFVWPISESQLYAEPKRLAAAGLIDMVEQPSGQRRTRKRYAITTKGRRELSRWRASPPPPEPWQSEIMLRVMLADPDDTTALRAALEEARRTTRRAHAMGAVYVTQNLEGDEPYPGRLALNAVWWELVSEQLRTRLAWIDHALDVIDQWPDRGDVDARARVAKILRGERTFTVPARIRPGAD